ncbi:PREDICTED: 21 kDa protein-like [Nelumbo nucifera]|uniref:21 kDa protein-like n=2 Tax=Nelumbo nucifera TaxID=4432 RepID=A0A1U8ATR5_NELNU|nr:PREDICTED: 21 kDa protein-like [Nelumbo nucifera]DAD32143.1 TPA_asm: hypothetical protein HUJ06_010994 [Nelumbo nucifera]
MAATTPLLRLLSPLLATAFFLLPGISAVDPTDPSSNATDFIRSSCSTTLYPDVCYTSLSRYGSAVQQDPGQLARLAIAVSLSNAHRTATYLSNLSREAETGADQGAAAVLQDCFTTFGDAVDQMRRSINEMRHINSQETFKFQMNNVQTWMSAALTNEDTCTEEFDDVPDGPTKTDVCDRVGNVRKFTSNALALVNTYVNSVTNATGSP